MFGLKCQLVCPEREEGVPVDDSLIPMIVVISVATEAIMPMTAIASARGVVEAGENDLFVKCMACYINLLLHCYS